MATYQISVEHRAGPSYRIPAEGTEAEVRAAAEATYRTTEDVVTVALFRDGRMRDVFYGSAGWHSDFDFHEDD
jgi:hypothetical protein